MPYEEEQEGSEFCARAGPTLKRYCAPNTPEGRGEVRRKAHAQQSAVCYSEARQMHQRGEEVPADFHSRCLAGEMEEPKLPHSPRSLNSRGYQSMKRSSSPPPREDMDLITILTSGTPRELENYLFRQRIQQLLLDDIYLTPGMSFRQLEKFPNSMINRLIRTQNDREIQFLLAYLTTVSKHNFESARKFLRDPDFPRDRQTLEFINQYYPLPAY